MQVPYAYVSCETARGKQVVGDGVEGNGPGGARVTLQHMKTLATGDVCHPYRMVTVGRTNELAVKKVPCYMFTLTIQY